ncbi:hypothetical protein ABBQ32_011471 [Trebouxia sp. C0010 RCD-2024]
MALSDAWSLSESRAAAPSTLGSTQAGCPDDLWATFQKCAKAQSQGRAAWWPQWECILYKPGETKAGVTLALGGVIFRHKPCGSQYGIKNLSQAAGKHRCETVYVTCDFACVHCPLQ